MSIILFIAILLGLILVHEFGHFAAAKFFGIKVEEFGIGFPPKLFGKKYGETEYTVNALPFGGFVRIYGEDGDALAGHDTHRAFSVKPRLVQAAVLVAGVAMNVVAAWLLVSLCLIIGTPTSATEVGFENLRNPQVMVLEVAPDSPAARAGILPGEEIIKVEGAEGAVLEDSAIADVVKQFIAVHGEEELTFTVMRGETVRTVTLTPAEGIIEGRRAAGVVIDDVGTRSLPVHLALSEGLVRTYELTIATAKGLGNFILSALTGKADFASVAGPVGIVGVVGEASQFGLVSVLMLAAVISINLAIINLVPFPALDGGRLLVVGIEAVVRRALPQKVTLWLNGVGFVILIGLMLAVTYSDISKLL